MKNFKVKARYLSETIEFEVEALDLEEALVKARAKAKAIFKNSGLNLNFWCEESHLTVKEK